MPHIFWGCPDEVHAHGVAPPRSTFAKCPVRTGAWPYMHMRDSPAHWAPAHGHSSQPTALGCPRVGLCLWGLWSLRHRFDAGEHGRPSCPRGGMQMVGWEGHQEDEESGWGALVSELSILGCRGGPLREAGQMATGLPCSRQGRASRDTQ